MASPPVFFSYSSRDDKVARTICAALEARGFSCWLASRDVRPGENYHASIVHAINDAKVLLLVFSANTNQSDEIKKELSLASRRRLPVIPVRVEDVLPDAAISYELATRQWIDLFAGWEAAMARLSDQLGVVVTPGPASATLPPPPLPAHHHLWRYGAIGAVALVLAGWLIFGRSTAPNRDVAAAPPPAAPSTPAPGANFAIPGLPAMPNGKAGPMPQVVQQTMRCMQADPDAAIKGCSEDLADPSVTGTVRAGYLRFRGSAYARKFDYDRAAADYTEALAITPGDGALYYLRSTVKRAKGDIAGADADAAKAKALGYGGKDPDADDDAAKGLLKDILKGVPVDVPKDDDN